jgi:hypothetical protein
MNNISILLIVGSGDAGGMKNTWIVGLILGIAGASAACGSDPSSAPDPDVTTDPVVDTAATGFPCDVHAVLQATCASCHAGRLYYGPNFVTRDDLFRSARELFLAASKPVAPGTFGEHVATALRDGTMPPYGSPAMPTPAERERVISWVEAGMPAGACGALSAP